MVKKKMSKPIFIKELKSYEFQYFDNIFTHESLFELSKLNVVKLDREGCQFSFVGVIIIEDVVINCYPKYFPDNDAVYDDFKQVISVIKKYNATNDTPFHENNQFEDSPFNLLSLMLFFIEDYYENGIYTKFENIFEINGNGEIDWNRTINNHYPIIKNNKPFYMEFETKNNRNDMYNYFRRLHECIVTECSKFLEKNDILNLFDLNSIELSENDLYDFGDKNSIKERLLKEMNVEFNTRKQKLLRAMCSYVCRDNATKDNFLTVYGTSNYHVVWEKMCSEIFSDKLKYDLTSLNIYQPLKKKYLKHENIYGIIEYPKWFLKDGTEMKSERNKLKPDIITFCENNFIILDAKYYNLVFEENGLEGNPGISDITKQYLYQLSLDDFRKDHGYTCVKNALLFPKYDGEIENRGKVKLKMFSKFNLEDIQVIMLPAGKVNEMYLSNKKIDCRMIIEILDES